MGLESVTMVLS